MRVPVATERSPRAKGLFALARVRPVIGKVQKIVDDIARRGD